MVASLTRGKQLKQEIGSVHPREMEGGPTGIEGGWWDLIKESSQLEATIIKGGKIFVDPWRGNQLETGVSHDGARKFRPETTKWE